MCSSWSQILKFGDTMILCYDAQLKSRFVLFLHLSWLKKIVFVKAQGISLDRISRIMRVLPIGRVICLSKRNNLQSWTIPMFQSWIDLKICQRLQVRICALVEEFARCLQEAFICEKLSGQRMMDFFTLCCLSELPLAARTAPTFPFSSLHEVRVRPMLPLIVDPPAAGWVIKNGKIRKIVKSNFYIDCKIIFL